MVYMGCVSEGGGSVGGMLTALLYHSLSLGDPPSRPPNALTRGGSFFSVGHSPFVHFRYHQHAGDHTTLSAMLTFSIVLG